MLIQRGANMVKRNLIVWSLDLHIVLNQKNFYLKKSY